MRISNVYTRTGDAGKTRLAGGQEVWQDSLRVEPHGTVDELNSVIGFARVFNGESVPGWTAAGRMEDWLKWIQTTPFDSGGILAATVVHRWR